MEEILKILKNIQEDINETKESVRKSETNLINKINEKFHEVQNKLQNLQVTVSSQEQRLDYLEKQTRERNVVIFGVEEKEQNYEDLHNKILLLFHHIMKIDCTSLEIQSSRRLGKKGEKARPIIVTLSTLKRKIEILRKKKTLEKVNYYIKEDYPPKILEIRKELQEKAKEQREKGKKVLIKYDKMIILSQIEPKENTNRGNKRNFPETSPENNSGSIRKTKETTQVQKKEHPDIILGHQTYTKL
ncbi:mRNA export factor GLE1-like [Maniola hyperantus]|uniref:mRNA export factor GLE1-like n=1 Tax=Aphantopus hyperantus TaxID=2795564 RepID=UPI00156815C9|nr:uncharacterized protein LOC117988537 [Maniola hyperantus]